MTDFAVFAQQIIDELTKEGRKHTADTRKHSANRILMFMGDNPTSMDKWDELFVQDYESWMKAQGLSASTTAYYLSQLCTFYKQKVELFRNETSFGWSTRDHHNQSAPLNSSRQ